MAERPTCEVLDSEEIHEKMCKRSVATANCEEVDDKPADCFPESNEPEAKENTQFEKIAETRRSFITKTKEDLSKVGTEKFANFIPKPKTAEEAKKGASSQGEDFKMPFTESASGGGPSF